MSEYLIDWRHVLVLFTCLYMVHQLTKWINIHLSLTTTSILPLELLVVLLTIREIHYIIKIIVSLNLIILFNNDMKTTISIILLIVIPFVHQSYSPAHKISLHNTNRKLKKKTKKQYELFHNQFIRSPFAPNVDIPGIQNVPLP